MTNGMKFIDVFHPARVIYDEKSDTTTIQLKGEWWDKEYCDQEYETVTGFADRCRECGRGKVLDKIRAEIDRQEKWLLQAGYTAYNVNIAFDAIKSAVERIRNGKI